MPPFFPFPALFTFFSFFFVHFWSLFSSKLPSFHSVTLFCFSIYSFIILFSSIFPLICLPFSLSCWFSCLSSRVPFLTSTHVLSLCFIYCLLAWFFFLLSSLMPFFFSLPFLFFCLLESPFSLRRLFSLFYLPSSSLIFFGPSLLIWFPFFFFPLRFSHFSSSLFFPRLSFSFSLSFVRCILHRPSRVKCIPFQSLAVLGTLYILCLFLSFLSRCRPFEQPGTHSPS